MNHLSRTALTLSLLALSGLAAAQSGLRVGMAYDAGGKFDKSFNQSAYEGSQRAVKSGGVSVKDFEPSDPSQTVQGIRGFAQDGFDLTIAVGFANNSSVTQVAKENPDLAFGLVDSRVGCQECPEHDLQGAGSQLPGGLPCRAEFLDGRGGLYRRHGHSADPQI